MGFYLNSSKPAALYANEIKNPYFVDKTQILSELISLVEQGQKYICITRPRRFGKTIMANMIASYFGKNSSREMFDSLWIGRHGEHEEYKNRCNVISISFNEMPDGEPSYDSYIGRIKSILVRDLKKCYPECETESFDAVWDILNIIHNETKEKFIFVFDEWDFIFHRRFITNENKIAYIAFLSNLLKDQPYVQFVYMTGILPIAKYSSGSEINMFQEYTMSSQHLFGTYFGFTDDEVDELYERYCLNTAFPAVSRDGLRAWYDGYEVRVKNSCEKTEQYSIRRLYNPRSVVFALANDQLGDYWTSSGPYDEIFYYVKNNIADVRDDIAKMIAGEDVYARVTEYSATSKEIKTREEILSAMVVYGFLTANDGKVRIPNRELMNKFSDMVKKENALGYVYRLAKESERMLKATKECDTDTMEAILQKAHDTETGMLGYNDEAELSAIVKLVYLSARDQYDIQREEKAGVGFVDYIFYPVRNRGDDCLIIELKVDYTAKEAIQQIKERKYIQRFLGKIGEEERYTGRILAVGIAYSKKDPGKQHECKVEILRGKI